MIKKNIEVGDAVICIDNGKYGILNGIISINKSYIVLKVVDDRVTIINDKGYADWFYRNRFELDDIAMRERIIDDILGWKL